jgi:flagellar biosynthesis protein
LANQNQIKKAVALRYKAYQDNAPIVVAKGKALLAEKIIEVAKKNNIPIHEDVDLVALLSKIDIMGEIPPELYKVIAEILSYLYTLNNKIRVTRS